MQFKYYAIEQKIDLICNLIEAVLDKKGNGVGYEIGIWRGQTAYVLLNKFSGLKYFGVDPYLTWKEYGVEPINAKIQEGVQHKLWFMDNESAEDIYQDTVDLLLPYADRATIIKKKSSEVVSEVADMSLDFVYIDGNHYYHYVLDDIRAWRDKIRPGGFLIGDDFNWMSSLDHVAKAVNQCFGFDYGVMADTWFWKKK